MKVDHASSLLDTGRDNSGFTLIEVLIALAVFSIGMIALGLMQISALRNVTHARDQTTALQLAQAQADILMSLPFYLTQPANPALWVDSDLNGCADKYEVNLGPNQILATGITHVDDTAWTDQYTLRWVVNDDFPLTFINSGLKSPCNICRSKTIRLWVHRDDAPDPDNIDESFIFLELVKVGNTE